MLVVSLLLAALVGYLLGSIPFAVLIARSQGVDIFTVGSGNPGATNVKRVLGKRAGNLCFVLDAFKGFLAASWPFFLAQWTEGPAVYLQIAGFLGALVGHSASVFIRFRGGKGVAVTIGGLLAVMPLVIAIGLLGWVAGFYASRIVAVGSLVLGVSLPISAFFLHGLDARFALALLLALVIVVRHKANIQRLLSGSENRF